MDAQITEPNQHYLKVKYVLNYPDKYDSFLFGSSRVGKIDVNKISHSTTGTILLIRKLCPPKLQSDLQDFAG